MESNKRDVRGRSKSDEAFDADIILQHLGNTGSFQFRFFICLAYAVLFPMATILVFNFTGATPAHRCFVDGCDDNVNPQFIADWMDDNVVRDLHLDSTHWQCSFAKVAICAVNITVNGTCSRWVFDKSIFSSTIVTDFLLVCENSWKPTFVSSLTMAGFMVGSLLLGPLPDVIGRRKAVLILSVWMSGFGIALSFSRSYQEFAALRFVNGMGCVALMQALAIWGLEAMAPSVRVRFIFIIFSFQSLGNLLTGMLAYFVRDWTTLQLYLFVPMILTITYFFILPESTRWLTAHKKFEKAKEIYIWAAEVNNKKIPPHLLLIPAVDSHDQTSSGNPEDASAWMSIWHVLKTPCLLKRLLILFCTWASALLSYYGLSYTASNLSKDVHLNFILVILVEIPAYLIGMFAVDVLGRRLIINLTLILGGSFCLVAGLVPQNRYDLILIFSLIGKFFISMQFVTVNMFTAEVFPTASRGLTIGLCSTVGKVGGILAPVMSTIGAKNRSMPYIVFGCINLVVGALSLMLPETKGLAIPATIQDAKDLESETLDLTECCRKKQQQRKLALITSYQSI